MGSQQFFPGSKFLLWKNKNKYIIFGVLYVYYPTVENIKLVININY